MPNPPSTTEFPTTRLCVEIDGRAYGLSQMSDGWVIPEPGVTLPTGDGVIVSVVGEIEHRWAVVVGEEDSTGGPTVAIRDLRPVDEVAAGLRAG